MYIAQNNNRIWVDANLFLKMIWVHFQMVKVKEQLWKMAGSYLWSGYFHPYLWLDHLVFSLLIFICTVADLLPISRSLYIGPITWFLHLWWLNFPLSRIMSILCPRAPFLLWFFPLTDFDINVPFIFPPLCLNVFSFSWFLFPPRLSIRHCTACPPTPRGDSGTVVLPLLS